MTVVFNPKLAEGEVVHDKPAAIIYVRSEREADMLMETLNRIAEMKQAA